MTTVALDPQPNAATSSKMFYRIQEVAKLTGLKPYVLRYWESEFKELTPAKDAADQRRYRSSDIEVILAIRKLLYEDRFTIQGARKRLRAELQKMREAAPAEPVTAPADVTIPTAPAAVLVAPPRAAAPEAPVRTIDTTLRRLRSEVNDLINMLSC